MSEEQKRFWAVRLNWLDARIIERNLPEHATLVAENLHQAWVDNDLSGLQILWDTFIAGNPALK